MYLRAARAGEWKNEQTDLKLCNAANQKFVSDKDASQEVAEGQEIVFTYDMVYKVMADEWRGRGQHRMAWEG